MSHAKAHPHTHNGSATAGLRRPSGTEEILIASPPQESWMGDLFRRNFSGKLSQIPPAAQFSGEHSGRNCIYQTGLI